MKHLVCLICVSVASIYGLGQNIEGTWMFHDEHYELTLDFEDKIFSIDTLKTVEGHAYYFTFPEDSCYLRINYIFANTNFECCQKEGRYLEIESCRSNGVTDTYGLTGNAKLYWRMVTDGRIEVVYNYCPGEKVEHLNRIVNVLRESLVTGQ